MLLYSEGVMRSNACAFWTSRGGDQLSSLAVGRGAMTAPISAFEQSDLPRSPAFGSACPFRTASISVLTKAAGNAIVAPARNRLRKSAGEADNTDKAAAV